MDSLDIKNLLDEQGVAFKQFTESSKKSWISLTKKS